MAGLIAKKRKIRDDPNLSKRKKTPQSDKRRKPSKTNGKSNKKEGERRKTGPRLPKKMVSFLNPKRSNTEEDDEEPDLYEYDEPIPEEESRKNRRYDPVENVQLQVLSASN